MSIATQLARLQNIKEAIRDALSRKGILASSHNMENFANDIDSIDVGIHTIDANVTSADVLSGKTFYGSNEIKEEGIMTNNGAVTASINTSTTSYTIPAGYHNGNGTVSLTTETKTATPKTTDQNITPSSGKVLSGVTVKGVSVSLPSASNILYGSTASVTSNGTTLGSVNGSMVNRGSVSQSLSANGSYTIPQGYHDGTGKVTQSLSTSTISGSWNENTYTASATSGYNGSAISTNTSLTKVTPSATGATVAANSRIYTSAFGYLFNARPEPTMSKNETLAGSTYTSHTISVTSGSKYLAIFYSYSTTASIAPDAFTISGTNCLDYSRGILFKGAADGQYRMGIVAYVVTGTVTTTSGTVTTKNPCFMSLVKIY